MLKSILTRFDRWRKHQVYFTPERLVRSGLPISSPSGRYTLVVENYQTDPGCWEYTRGIVSEGGREIARIDRNYHRFMYAWHTQGGVEYLFASRDYQGYGVLNCATGEFVQYIPKEAEQGIGWCWDDIRPLEENRLEVEGCYWACPYEVVQYDITNIMQLPYPELSRKDASPLEIDEEDE